ncbi:MAG: protein-export chaperone SecB [Proteobacteria bacterium]|nr:protein-export chaperone SecB [Pseudomonadota bacterium]
MSGQIRLERMYLKDASFESPASPQVFRETWKPEIQVDINTRSERIETNYFEVVVSATITAKMTKTAFIAEVQYAGLFMIEGVAGEDLRRALGTICPNTLFPYIRESVDSLVVKGGFPALHLAPMNFDALYTEAMRKQKTPGADVTH